MSLMYWAKELAGRGFPVSKQGILSLENMPSDGCPKGLDLKKFESAVSTNSAITIGEPSAEFSVSHPTVLRELKKD